MIEYFKKQYFPVEFTGKIEDEYFRFKVVDKFVFLQIYINKDDLIKGCSLCADKTISTDSEINYTAENIEKEIIKLYKKLKND